MSKVIALIIAHLPPDNKVLRSMYLVRKFIAGKNAHFTKHSCCSNCKKTIAPGAVCIELGCEQSKPLKFLIFPIEEQIRNLFQRASFREVLENRLPRKKLNNDNLEDIYDGILYSRFSSFLSSPYNFSLSYYTDGVELFKSAKSTVWPAFFPINELPYNKIYLPENMVFGGLWYGGTKPDFNIFFRPLYDSFVRLRSGISITLHNLNNTVITVKSIVLNGIADIICLLRQC
jgi:hypothetical protein